MCHLKNASFISIAGRRFFSQIVIQVMPLNTIASLVGGKKEALNQKTFLHLRTTMQRFVVKGSLSSAMRSNERENDHFYQTAIFFLQLLPKKKILSYLPTKKKQVNLACSPHEERTEINPENVISTYEISKALKCGKIRKIKQISSR